jgi:hypothetical protein
LGNVRTNESGAAGDKSFHVKEEPGGRALGEPPIDLDHL